MWPFTLSGRLLIVALVGRYPANKLIRRGSISYHRSFSHCTMRYCALMRYYQSFPTAIPLYEAGYPRVTHPSATKCPVRRSDTPFDLHVLGTPPAFILSQDQTLMFEWSRLTASCYLFQIFTWFCSFLNFLLKRTSGLLYYLIVNVLLPQKVSLYSLSHEIRHVNNFFSKHVYFVKRRRRDLNPRAGFPTYTLSRGASSAS